VLLGDDHTLFRHGVRKILEERPEWEIVAEVGDGREAVRKCLAIKPDVAVLDVGMPLLNGIDATQQIVRKAPETKVLVLSMHSDEAYVTRALQAGATGYMLKDSAGKDLLKGIASVAAGQAYSARPWRS
jgi:DNA-binding NarL/FixJ family response regulator